jgi:biotin carboxyl carrier protein
MRFRVTVQGEVHMVELERDVQHGWHASVDGAPVALDRAQVTPGQFSLLLGTRSFEVFVRPLPGENGTQRFDVFMDGAPVAVDVVDERLYALAGMGKGHGARGEVTVKAPMPGLVAHVLVTTGDAVERGQRVVVLEAMKMHNDLLAPRAGIVRAVKTAPDQAVNQGQPLVVIGDPEGQTNEPEDDE